MVENKVEVSKDLEKALQALEQVKQHVANEKKKQNEKKLSRYEQKTIVNYNAEKQTATVYTRNRAVSTEQRKRARQMMIERNREKGD